MRIEKVIEPQNSDFVPVTVKFTAETRRELELLVGFLFLDALDPESNMSSQDGETLMDIADEVEINPAVRALYEATKSDLSLRVLEGLE